MRRFFLLVVWPLLAWAASPLNAQQTPAHAGAARAHRQHRGGGRLPRSRRIHHFGHRTGHRAAASSWRDIQRAIAAVYRSGGFDDVKIDARLENGKNILVITVVERPLLASWTVVGAVKIPIGRRCATR